MMNIFAIDVTHTHLMALCPGLPRRAGTRKVKPIWILLKQETVSGSGISWAICKSAPGSRQITMPAPHQSVFACQMPFLPPNQQHQSTEGIAIDVSVCIIFCGTLSSIDRLPVLRFCLTSTCNCHEIVIYYV